MTSADFAAFYRAVHDGHGPFPWQERLAEQVIGEGKWPDTLSIPTACGKTSALDVAVFALATQAQLPPGERRAPLRIFFVIDRRLVVDDVTEHAKKLAKAINESDDTILVEVREELRRFGGAVPLAVATLRGGCTATIRGRIGRTSRWWSYRQWIRLARGCCSEGTA